MTSVQRAFRRQFQSDPPPTNSIRRWYQQFQSTGCLCRGKSAGRLFSGASGDNFRVISHLPTALVVGISSFRRRGVFVKGKVQDVCSAGLPATSSE
jgi:hypothetical protein